MQKLYQSDTKLALDFLTYLRYNQITAKRGGKQYETA